MLSWITVQSSAISAAAYQGSSLFIRFNTGREYEYYDVPEKLYLELLNAPSKGKYFNAQVKDQYKYRRIC